MDSKRKKVLKELEMIAINILPEPNDGVLFHGLDMIFNKVHEEKLNSIEEKIMLYSVILNGVYGVSFEKTNDIVENNGIFLFASCVEEEFSNEEIFKYYVALYREHKQNKIFENNTKNTQLIVEEIIKNVIQGIRDIDLKDIGQTQQEIQATLNKMGLINKK